ncbi:MAG: alpha/beta fold hydrolase [SAR324 cluster bacterium]|nr:alpha/beta fold hydrolase [SAR324 cluster bacterium]
MKIIQEPQVLGSIPLLLFYPSSFENAVARGCVLFFHGLGASKEEHILELSRLAKSGFLVVSIDNVGHGERRYQDFDGRFSAANPQRDQEFLNVILQTKKEVPGIIESLERKKQIRLKKIGVAGVSLGGFIAYSAMLEEPEFKAASVILGSPKWRVDHPESPHHHAHRFFPVALLSQNAGRDSIVPPCFAKEFHQKLEHHYEERPERQKYIEYPHSEHFMLLEDWMRCWQELTQWFEKFL